MPVGERTPRTWNNERWVIDRLVDAVEAGDTDAKTKLGQRLLDGIDQDDWNVGKLIEAGPFLPLLAVLDPDNIEDDDLQWFCEDETIPDSRLNEVLNGGLSGVELNRWRQRVAERSFDPVEDDRELLRVLIVVRRTGGRLAYVAAFGYDLGALTFVAAYDTYTETLAALKGVGFLSLDDYQARSGELLVRGTV